MVDKIQKTYRKLFLMVCVAGLVLFIAREVYVIMSDTAATPVLTDAERKWRDSVYMATEETEAQLQIFKDDTPGVNGEADSIKKMLQKRLKKLDSLAKH